MKSPGYSKHPKYQITTHSMKKKVEVYISGKKIVDSTRAVFYLSYMMS
ncbi:MAG: hypothetical protein AB7I27_02275 [Bacteriovoracaceae bacterium]